VFVELDIKLHIYCIAVSKLTLDVHYYDISSKLSANPCKLFILTSLSQIKYFLVVLKYETGNVEEMSTVSSANNSESFTACACCCITHKATLSTNIQYHERGI